MNTKNRTPDTALEKKYLQLPRHSLLPLRIHPCFPISLPLEIFVHVLFYMIDITMFLFETDSTVLLEHAIQTLMVTQHQIVILLSWNSLVYVLYINISIIYIHASYIYIYIYIYEYEYECCLLF